MASTKDRKASEWYMVEKRQPLGQWEFHALLVEVSFEDAVTATWEAANEHGIYEARFREHRIGSNNGFTHHYLSTYYNMMP